MNRHLGWTFYLNEDDSWVATKGAKKLTADDISTLRKKISEYEAENVPTQK